MRTTSCRQTSAHDYPVILPITLAVPQAAAHGISGPITLAVLQPVAESAEQSETSTIRGSMYITFYSSPTIHSLTDPP